MKRTEETTAPSRQYDVGLEYDPEAGQNLVAYFQEIFPHDAEDLAKTFRAADDFEDIFLVWRMHPERAREIAQKLLEVADACEQIRHPVIRRDSDEAAS